MQSNIDHMNIAITGWMQEIITSTQLNQSQIASKCGIEPYEISRLKNAGFKDGPTLGTLLKVMKTFKSVPFPFDKLVDPDGRKPFGKKIDTCSVYLWTWGELKLDVIDPSNNLAQDGQPRQVMYHTATERENVIALPVVDDAMDAIAPKGSIIFVDLDDVALEHEGTYVILFQGTPIFRRYRNDGDVHRFEPQGIVHKDETIFPRTSDALKGEPKVKGRVFHVGREL